MELWQSELRDKYYLDDENRKIRIKSLKKEIKNLKDQIKFAEYDRLTRTRKSFTEGRRGGWYASQDLAPRVIPTPTFESKDREELLEKKKKQLKFLKDMNKERKKTHKK